ncbi:hypothetical protein PRIPAC_73128 [Pristionchus pacificus]|uniref:PB1 domain-containing protein n=1 Tax=Pristionchus pacificus TaxID=54126 RepID=A0A454XWL4_PRIPA|nr:hypothetical protein PRIPAC_73128 [Pristionchus pacificus]|eukprot:PDM72032.1 hypothetical protein PRIPAC_38439 [Pristionchus pacificus]
MTIISPPVHFELTYKGDIRRFALSGTNEQILSAIRERVAATFGASEKQLNIGWKVIPGTSSLPLCTSDDLSRAIDQSNKSNDQCIKIVVDTAPITAKMLDLCCTLCDEPLEGEYVQCPSSSHHAFCFRCTTIFLWKHAKDQEIYCPSGEECCLDDQPWDFWDATIKEILGDDYEDFVEIRADARETIVEDEGSDESKSFVNPFECPTNSEMDELRERVRRLEENEKMINEREDKLRKRLYEIEMQLRAFGIKNENIEPLH